MRTTPQVSSAGAFSSPRLGLRRYRHQAPRRAILPVYAGNSAGKWEFQELFSSSDLLERASQLARAGKVTEAEAILSAMPGRRAAPVTVAWSSVTERSVTSTGRVSTPTQPAQPLVRRRVQDVENAVAHEIFAQFSYNTASAVNAREEEAARVAVLTATAKAAQEAALAAGVPPDGGARATKQQLALISISAGVRAAIAPLAARARANAPPSRRRGITPGALVDGISDVAGMVTFLSDLPLAEAEGMEEALEAALHQRYGTVAIDSTVAVVTDNDALALMTGVAWMRALAGNFAASYALLTDALDALPRHEENQADLLLLTMYCAKMAQAKGDMEAAEAHWLSVLDLSDAIFGANTANDVALEACKALVVLSAARGSDNEVQRWTAQAAALTRGMDQRRREPLHMQLARQSGPPSAYQRRALP